MLNAHGWSNRARVSDGRDIIVQLWSRDGDGGGGSGSSSSGIGPVPRPVTPARAAAAAAAVATADIAAAACVVVDAVKSTAARMPAHWPANDWP